MMDDADRDLFSATVRAAVARHSGSELDAALAEVGWHDALAVDPRVAVSTLFEAQGAEGHGSSALADLLASTLGLPHPLVLPALGRSGPPGRAETVGAVPTGAGAGTGFDVDGLVLGAGPTVSVLAAGPDEQLVAVAAAVADLRPITVAGIDPALGLGRVHGHLASPDEHATAISTGAWDDAVRVARLALAHELIGASGTMLAQAREHALDRVQFDRPIAMFQAIRHRLAETLVAIEAARAMLDAAWDDGSTSSATMAKALAGTGARTTARHCQQVLAGIGFTTEHPLHLSIRRVLVLDELFGAARTLTRELGAGIIADQRLPALLPL